MPLRATLVSAIAATVFFAGLHHLFVGGRRRPSASPHLAFGLMSVALAAYVAAEVLTSWSTSMQTYIDRLAWQYRIGLFYFPLLVWFYSAYTRVRPRFVLPVVSLACVGLLGFELFKAEPLFFDITDFTVATQPWGEPVPAPTIIAIPYLTQGIHIALNVLYVSAHGFGVFATFRLFRRGERGRATVLGSALVVFLVAAVADQLVPGTSLAWVPASELGFLYLVGVMSFGMTNEVIHAGAVERALIESEENLRATLDSIGEAVLVLDADGAVMRMNPVAEELVGLASDDARGRRLDEALRLDPEVVPRPLDDTPVGVTYPSNPAYHELVDGRGGVHQVAMTISSLRNRDGKVGSVLVLRDVTEQLLLEEKLRHAYKLDAIGQLAGGVAHDFNNLLMAINGYAEVLSAAVEDDPELERAARTILESGERAAELTSHLLDFSRKEPRTWERFSLHETVEHAAGMIARTIDRRIVLSMRLGAESDVLHGDPSALQTAVLNLAINARDAMPEGGGMTIATRNVVLEAEYCRASTFDLAPGPYLELIVADSGTGISPDIRDRVFDPFFTTKEFGKGTGLGLAAVYGTVTSHGGAIELESSSLGTAFHMFLPVEVGAVGDRTARAPDREPAHGKGTVLVVDDEDAIRGMLETTLPGLGYSVVTASDGDDALRIVGADPAEIDVVMLDLMMCDKTGVDVFRELREKRPRLPVLFITGYAGHFQLEEVLAESRVGLLHKPFRRMEMATALLDLLDD